jgi:hypothetical protein
MPGGVFHVREQGSFPGKSLLLNALALKTALVQRLVEALVYGLVQALV